MTSRKPGAARGRDKAGQPPRPNPGADRWADDPDRLDAIMRRIMAGFGPRLRGVGFRRSVPGGPLDVVHVDLDRVRVSDMAAVRKEIAEDCVLSRTTFAVEAMILPRHAGPIEAGRLSPHDRGRAAPEALKAALASLKKGDFSGLAFHDNLLGRAVTVLGRDPRDRGRFLLRTVSASGIIDRTRMGPELVELLSKGWWTA